jgi:pimeloyl-ACP methyl ester carboxylesterase
MTNPRRGYLDNAEGQLHVWSWEGAQANQSPLVCLPPVPFGGRFFARFARAYEGPVWSADLPGYGFSDPLSDKPTVAGFTRAMSPLLAASETPVWLTGFHSGALVAMEMAQAFPAQVAGLVLVDVPVFAGPGMESLRDSLTVPPQYLTQEDPLNGLFESMVVDRLTHVPFDRAFDLFVDFISAGEDRNAGFRAAATYDVEAACLAVQKPTLVIATQSSLREGTLQTANWIPKATLVERDDVTAPAFERGAEVIAALVSDFVTSSR